MDALIRYFRQALRQLRQQPAFSATAIGVLALGIGANAAIFTLVNAMLLKPLQIEQADRLVGLYPRNVERPDDYRAFSYAEYATLRERPDVFSGLVAHTLSLVGVLEGETTRRAFSATVSSNYFDVLGAPLSRGRSFSLEEEHPGAGIPTVVVSHSFWRRHGSDPEIVGSTLTINGRPFTVVGVTSPGFSGFTAVFRPELYLPLGTWEIVRNDFDGLVRPLADPENRSLMVIGRLNDGLTLEAADARLEATASALDGLATANERWTLIARPLSRMSISTHPTSDAEVKAPITLIVLLAVTVLLVASLNVANMMLARGASRRREIAIRLALGAGRRGLVLQLVCEGLVLAVAGGLGGLVLAFWGTKALAGSLAALVPIDLAFSAVPDARVVGATLLVCLGSTLVFALAPAWNVSRPEVASDLKPGTALASAGSGRRRVLSRRNLLVIGQLALSLVLLTVAGLFVRSALRAAALEPGFRIADQLVVEVDPSLTGADPERSDAVIRRALERLRALPEVRSASLGATVPFGMVSLGRSAQKASDAPSATLDPDNPAGSVDLTYNLVGGDYFETLDIPLQRGRPFSLAETSGLGAPPVAMIDRLAAEKLWPGEDPVGRRIRLLGNDAGREAVEAEVVGVVGNVREHLLGQAIEPHVYLPYGQETVSNVSFHLSLAPLAPAGLERVVADVHRVLREVDDRLPVFSVRTLGQHVDSSADVWLMRTASRMFTLFGMVAALLAAVGLYGVRAFSVARRTREIGIRIALGSSARDAQLLVLREGLRVTAVGAAIGLALSIAIGRLLAGMLYEVSGADPAVLLGAPLFLGLVSLIACWVPARRAASVQPATALRSE